MREIKFRAMRNNGKWVIGNYVHHFISYFDTIERHSIFLSKSENDNGGHWVEDIITKTIGQFTGLYDKNHKEIYEGDILKWSKGRLYVVKFLDGMFYASVEECNDGILGGFPLHRLTEDEDGKCEIVGNIFDNSELLKGGLK